MDGAVEKDSGPESLSSSESDELEEEDGVGRVATGITGRAAEFVVAGSLAGGAVAVGGRGIAADAGDGEVAGLTLQAARVSKSLELNPIAHKLTLQYHLPTYVTSESVPSLRRSWWTYKVEHR